MAVQPDHDVVSEAEMPDRNGGPTSPGDEALRSAVRDASLSAVWLDQDLSWIEFNRRVLAETLDDRTPLFERVTRSTAAAVSVDPLSTVSPPVRHATS
jgi:hypothetical protein